MSSNNNRRYSKGRLPPFVPMVKATMNTPAWRAMSHGPRSLYVALRARYNTKLQNGVYLSIRTASAELGSFSHIDNIGRWFRELQYYGFIVMVSGANLGVEGRGKAPHYRLTEEFYLGKPPTREYLNWDGEVFHEQKPPSYYHSKRQRKFVSREKQNPVPPVRYTLYRPSGTVGAVKDQNEDESVPPVRYIQPNDGVPPVRYITSLTTDSSEASLIPAYEAAWSGENIKPLGLSRLHQRPAKRPDRLATARCLAAWYDAQLSAAVAKVRQNEMCGGFDKLKEHGKTKSEGIAEPKVTWTTPHVEELAVAA